jgi:phosphoribosyl 1,2-cyclic phosphodiesterase
MPGFDPPTTSDLTTKTHTRGDSNIANQFSVRFWGVRGSIPTPGMETVRYGGNTACVELQVAGKRLIFDGGTGLRALGKSLMEHMPVEAHLFFTHTHWDRIQGFPFFIPAFVKDNCFHIYGSIGPNGASIKQRLSDQMLRPNFPVPLQVMQSDLRFNNIAPGSVITLDDIVVETISLNRPNSALGYRVTCNGHSVVYATDTEHLPDKIDNSLLYLAQQADVLIYDVAYADHAYYDPKVAQEFQQREIWQKGLAMAFSVGVKQIIMFHHDPAHEDEFLDQVETEVQASFPNVKLAREGMVLDILQPS